MTAAVVPPVTAIRPVVIRAAPRREPPFDDELTDRLRGPGPLDQRLPFAPAAASTPVWAALPPRPDHLPDPNPWARRLLIGLIESAAGRRPLHQIVALLSPSVAHGLSADFERAARGGAPHWLHRATVRSVRASQPTDGVAELCATLATGDRVRAVALRLEEHRGRWRCTRLQLG